ncbi:exodeoxyribonuclease VII small subunit [Novipirellula artificiosorum]|uniref:Exodeoxyribonuclease 7 small subunit n=1 Tax=Novipirellula artificiosorum TaxID=2528016 RepID=A0A5C6DIN5_9BACT|nr:exodeoxyribonuclease VII small subunit [Novipirellula artificiosorum]TWU36075.1 Exodeoxyribonuclease 7 small subunit [Novipirellula artificiosorum]
MPKKKRSQPDSVDHADSGDIDFESALSEVEKIVHQLESGELGLTESLREYELGIKRLNQCHQLLESAEQKITMLSGFDAEGNAVTVSFGDSESSEDEPTRAGRRNRSGSRASQKKTVASSDMFDDSDNDDDAEIDGLF